MRAPPLGDPTLDDLARRTSPNPVNACAATNRDALREGGCRREPLMNDAGRWTRCPDCLTTTTIKEKQ